MLNLAARSRIGIAVIVAFLFCSAAAVNGQDISFKYLYSFEPAMITEPPEMGGIEIVYPDAARKNGVEGTVNATFTLGEDGKVRDVVIVNDLPHGVGDAVRAGLQKLFFKPARFQGKPAAMKAKLEYKVTVLFEDSDKNVTKPKFTSKPEPVYPEKYRAEKVKGKVVVGVTFLANGELLVGNASSNMPREFDKAAIEAAKAIKFTPAIHKKSKQPVSQHVFIEYDFRP